MRKKGKGVGTRTRKKEDDARNVVLGRENSGGGSETRRVKRGGREWIQPRGRGKKYKKKENQKGNMDQSQQDSTGAGDKARRA